MTWIEISSISAASAFIILVVFAVRTLLAASRSLQQVSEAIQEAQRSLAETTAKSDQLLHSAKLLTDEAYDQLQKLKACASGAEQAGAALGEVSFTLRKASQAMTKSIHGAEKVVHTHQRRLQDAIEWATTGVELWQRWQAYRQSKADSAESAPSYKGVERHGN